MVTYKEVYSVDKFTRSKMSVRVKNPNIKISSILKWIAYQKLKILRNLTVRQNRKFKQNESYFFFYVIKSINNHSDAYSEFHYNNVEYLWNLFKYKNKILRRDKS